LQVFIIAAREFLDFAVFLLFILVLLGSAVFAFFQLTGGNFQFLRFADGLSLMSRLTFGEWWWKIRVDTCCKFSCVSQTHCAR
jgi:hypothetical protein